jgi:hypothetical protein
VKPCDHIAIWSLGACFPRILILFPNASKMCSQTLDEGSWDPIRKTHECIVQQMVIYGVQYLQCTTGQMEPLPYLGLEHWLNDVSSLKSRPFASIIVPWFTTRRRDFYLNLWPKAYMEYFWLDEFKLGRFVSESMFMKSNLLVLGEAFKT